MSLINVYVEKNVNHPAHYKRFGRKECIVEMRERYGAGYTAVFCLMNSYKYLYRCGEKDRNPSEQDMAKAKWYFNYVADVLLTELDDSFLKNESFENLFLDIKSMLYGE